MPQRTDKLGGGFSQLAHHCQVRVVADRVRHLDPRERAGQLVALEHGRGYYPDPGDDPGMGSDAPFPDPPKLGLEVLQVGLKAMGAPDTRRESEKDLPLRRGEHRQPTLGDTRGSVASYTRTTTGAPPSQIDITAVSFVSDTSRSRYGPVILRKPSC
jgi:hypothetical protein